MLSGSIGYLEEMRMSLPGLETVSQYRMILMISVIMSPAGGG